MRLHPKPMKLPATPAICRVCLGETEHSDSCPHRPGAPRCEGCGRPIELCIYDTMFCGVPSLRDEVKKLRALRAESVPTAALERILRPARRRLDPRVP